MSARRRREILDALRRGTVPSNGLDQLAVGLGDSKPNSMRRWTPSLPGRDVQGGARRIRLG
ncbi:hypothetical protein I552_6027 [Mycobacterium xenopi 3993]|nr:hypothetical protein I552_6027 [Mycobacterium xenopi 3993]